MNHKVNNKKSFKNVQNVQNVQLITCFFSGCSLLSVVVGFLFGAASICEASSFITSSLVGFDDTLCSLMVGCCCS